MPTAEGITMARMLRRPKAIRRRNPAMSPSAHRADSEGVTALMIDTAMTP